MQSGPGSLEVVARCAAKRGLRSVNRAWHVRPGEPSGGGDGGAFQATSQSRGQVRALSFWSGWFWPASVGGGAIRARIIAGRSSGTVQQPVPFSHEHHVSGLGIDCRFCHTSVTTSSNAGLPPTYTCMTCHSQIWTNAQMLAPVRDSLARNEPIHWHRVYDLPDYVFFNHSIHITKGVGCASCHGEVNRMPLTYKAVSLEMTFCIDCHQIPVRACARAARSSTWSGQRTAATPSPSRVDGGVSTCAPAGACSTARRATDERHRLASGEAWPNWRTIRPSSTTRPRSSRPCARRWPRRASAGRCCGSSPRRSPPAGWRAATRASPPGT